MIIKYTLLLYE